MALLQTQQTRYHQSVRPRLSNPTYASTNVGSTLGMHLPFIARSISNRYSVPNLMEYPASNQSSRRSNSQLSNAGSSSLKNLNRYISDRQVYEKQQKNYNIISVQPKQYPDTIKYFPIYRLQNKDYNYFKKMQLQKQLTQRLVDKKLNKGINPQQNRYIKRGKYLNNVDQVADIL